ncbi:putative membrane protein [Psychrobacter sp. PL15]|uniref:hypothetical protein n=1 Tax=Psychrobacter sp. PL15 TaxID=3071719 RepID=UPI002DFD9743|nr:putative membrane protein [Psychrobacter sp. PL15]
MNNRKIAGIITAVIGLSAVMALFNAGMSVPIISWPLEAYLGVAFTIVFMTGVPIWLACVIAALIFILIAVALYKLGGWVYGRVAG